MAQWPRRKRPKGQAPARWLRGSTPNKINKKRKIFKKKEKKKKNRPLSRVREPFSSFSEPKKKEKKKKKSTERRTLPENGCHWTRATWFRRLDRILLGFTGFYLVLLSLLGFIRFWLGFDWVWLGLIGFYGVLLSFTRFYWVWLDLTGFDWVWWIFIGF